MSKVVSFTAPSAADDVSLRLRSSMGIKKENVAQVALDHTLFIVNIRLHGELIGLGRG